MSLPDDFRQTEKVNAIVQCSMEPASESDTMKYANSLNQLSS